MHAQREAAQGPLNRILDTPKLRLEDYQREASSARSPRQGTKAKEQTVCQQDQEAVKAFVVAKLWSRAIEEEV